jgi:hypothetical protein
MLCLVLQGIQVQPPTSFLERPFQVLRRDFFVNQSTAGLPVQALKTSSPLVAPQLERLGFGQVEAFQEMPSVELRESPCVASIHGAVGLSGIDSERRGGPKQVSVLLQPLTTQILP